MKNCLDIYLQHHAMTRYDVSKKSGVSEQTLSKASKRNPNTLTAKTLIAISKGTGESPGEVLDALLKILESDELYIVTTLVELRQKINEQEDEFIVRGEYRELLKEIENSRLSEESLLGFQLGSRGMGDLIVWGLNRVRQTLADNPKMEKLKQDILDLYQLKIMNGTEMKLRLKQLDY